METSVESIDGGRVRLSVEIPAADFEKAVNAAFHKLAQEVKLRGFRPGKAPRRLLEQRLGPGVAREHALRDALPEYYADALAATGVDAIAAPEIEITSGQDEGDVTFEAVVPVRPKAELSGYRRLRVVLDRPEPSAEDVRGQIDRLREQFADLEESAAPLADGDYAQVDLKGYVHDDLVEGLSATDFLYEVGSAQLVPRLDEELRGSRPGEILKFTDTVPEHFGERAGEDVAFQVLVKAAKRKVLPALTDEWVQDASEFEAVADLERDVRRRLDVLLKVQAQVALRDKLLDAGADLVAIDPPEPLVDEEVRRRVHDLAHRLRARDVTLEQYLDAAGLTDDQFLARVRIAAVQAVKADLALRAVVEQEAIEVSEAEVEDELARLAERVNKTPAEVRAELDRGGGLEAIRSEVARGKALQFLVDHAEVVDERGEPIDLALPDAPVGEAEPERAGEHT